MGASVAELLITVGEFLLRATVKVESSFFFFGQNPCDNMGNTKLGSLLQVHRMKKQRRLL